MRDQCWVFWEGLAGWYLGSRCPLSPLAVECRKRGSWEVGTSEQGRREGRGAAGLAGRGFAEPMGFHGNLVTLFLKNAVPQSLLWA